jgi:hypothetical protein
MTSTRKSRRRRLSISAAFAEPPECSVLDWPLIEKALGCALAEHDRQFITSKVDQYFKDHLFELKGPFADDAIEYLADLYKAAIAFGRLITVPADDADDDASQGAALCPGGD